MRLIDADALFRAINRIRCPQGASMGDGLAEACQAILDAPTIDAVPVVRCVNCVHFGAEAVAFDAWTPYCLKHRMAVFHDDFCSCGERKDGEGL